MISALSDLQRNGLAEDETAINHVLYLFLGQQDQFINELKGALSTISGFDEIVQDLMYHCLSALESGQYVLCETKHMYLKVHEFRVSGFEHRANVDQSTTRQWRWEFSCWMIKAKRRIFTRERNSKLIRSARPLE